MINVKEVTFCKTLHFRIKFLAQHTPSYCLNPGCVKRTILKLGKKSVKVNFVANLSELYVLQGYIYQISEKVLYIQGQLCSTKK